MLPPHDNISSADNAAIDRHVATAQALGKTYRRSRLLLFGSSTLLLLVVGLWIRSFFGFGLINYCPVPDGPILSPENKELVIAAESGSLTLAQVPTFYLPSPGWRLNYLPYAHDGPAGDGGEWTSRVIGHPRCHSGIEDETLGGYPYYWICSVPFWFSATLLAMVVILAARRGSAAKSRLLTQEYGSLIQTHDGDASSGD